MKMAEINEIEEYWSDADESLLAKCDHYALDSDTPLATFMKTYLCVTNLTQQLWCEQHLQYTLLGVEPDDITEMAALVPLPTADRPEVKQGKNIHLARELEVHDIVSVNISSIEDKWALHILNLHTVVQGFLFGIPVAREIPIFGDPFGTGDLLFGIIDELRFDEVNYTLCLVELKTRKSTTLPGKTQQKQHAFQVEMYKRLWDNLVKGEFSSDFFFSKLGLGQSADLPLSKEINQLMDTPTAQSMSLRQLLSQLLSFAQALVCISSMQVEYIHQGTDARIGRSDIQEDPKMLQCTFQTCMDFWHGRREVKGVEIEEAWKCAMCEYANSCGWRKKKSLECLEKNKLTA